MKEKMYAVLMNKKIIDTGIYLFSPVYMIGGIYDEKEDEFTSELGESFVSFNNSEVIVDDLEQCVGYVVSESDLLKMYPDMNITEALSEYYDEIRNTIHVGYYLIKNDAIAVIKYDLGQTATMLNNMEIDPNASKVEVPVEELTGNDTNTNASNDDILKNAVVMKFEDFDKLVQNIDDVEYVKNFILTIGDAVDKAKSMVVDAEAKEVPLSDDEKKENEDDLYNGFKGNHIETAFEIGYKGIMELTNTTAIYQIFDELIDSFTNLSLLLDVRSKNLVEVEIAKDYIYYLVDALVEIAKLTDVNEIHTKTKELHDREIVNIKQLCVVYDRCSKIYLDEKKEAEKQMKKEVSVVKKEEVKNKVGAPIVDVKDAKRHFDDVIIGQERAKRAVIMAIVKNKRSKHPSDKNNILLLGPTGSGKTLVAQTISEYFDMPLEIVDSTQITQAGYVGESLEGCLANLIYKAGGDLDKAEHGIIVFDEIDKKGTEKNDDVAGRAVLNSLLPFIQGTTYNVKCGSKSYSFCTDKLTIMATGSFADVVEKMKNDGVGETSDYKQHKIGFNSQLEDTDTKKEDITYPKLKKEDLIKYGHMPAEFMGRLPVMVQLDGHTIESLGEILTKSKISTLLLEKEKLECDGYSLSWTKGYLDAVAKKAIELKTGARSLKETVETSVEAGEWELYCGMDTYCGLILTEKTVEDNTDCLLIDQNGITHNVKDIIAGQKCTSLAVINEEPKVFVKTNK